MSASIPSTLEFSLWPQPWKDVQFYQMTFCVFYSICTDCRLKDGVPQNSHNEILTSTITVSRGGALSGWLTAQPSQGSVPFCKGDLGGFTSQEDAYLDRQSGDSFRASPFSLLSVLLCSSHLAQNSQAFQELRRQAHVSTPAPLALMKQISDSRILEIQFFHI